MKKHLVMLIFLPCLLFLMAAGFHAAESAIAWTEDELAFMQAHPVIRLGVDPGFVPFEFIDEDGTYKGITADYLSLLSAKTGLTFEVVPGLSWPEAYDSALNGGVDLLPAISRTEERSQHFLFSDPYYFFHRVIVTRDTETGIADIDDLSGQTVAVQRNSSHHSYLLSFPQINLSLYDAVETALAAVANGTERAYVGNLATTNYLVRSQALTNLKFIAFEAEKRQALYFAVRRDWPQLVSIIDKAMNAVTAEEKAAINNRWIGFESEIDFGPIWRTILIISSFLMVVLAVSAYWIIRLRKEVYKRQLIQADLEKAKLEAEAANGFKSNFLARMSHEIRTPLTAISGMAWLLKKTPVSPTQNTYVDRITQASGHMLNIVNDILDIARIESGKIELETVSFRLDQVVQSVVSIVAGKIEEQGIAFKLAVDDGIAGRYLGDPKRLEQILLNLLNNAAKFTSSGEVSLTVDLIEQTDDSERLSFAVRDTGIGMTEDQLQNLFEPFMQGDSSINRRFGGSGLGLSIVKNLVDLMAGNLQVHSKPGEGSVFLVELPLRVDGTAVVRDALPAGQEQGSTFMYRGSRRVLLVEDNQTNQLIAASLLRQAGIEPIMAENGQAAVALFREHRATIGLILMDLHMPVMNGYEAAGEIRKLSGDVPIVAMTADVIQGVQEKCAQSGIHHYLSKPFDPDRFSQLVKDLLPDNDAVAPLGHDQSLNPPHDLLLWDRSAGLRNLGGNHELFHQVLQTYLEENRAVVDQLTLAVRESRFDLAVQIVHKVKGSSGSIGAMDLYHQAADLQHALTEEKLDTVIPLTDRFTHDMIKLLQEIEETLASV